jgi:hypothetical protein
VQAVARNVNNGSGTMRSTYLLCTMVLISCQPGVGGSEACEGPLGKPITSFAGMTACCQAEAGAAHCLEDSRVPGDIKPFLAACDSGGYCIPDDFLETGAAVPPDECMAFGGSGVCLSKCIPQVAENAGLLRKETCTGADELCVPCISPLDNMPTGACDLLTLAACVGEGGGGSGSGGNVTCDDPATCNYEASCPALIDPSTFPSCGPDAHCVDPALISDPAQQMQLGKCTDGVKLCVPDVFIKTGGKFTAPTCNSVGGAEGRCLSRVIPEVKAQEALLPQDSCTANERCTPCYDPTTGMSTGACNLSCDTGPTRAPVVFPQCCDNQARCVPVAAIPDAQEANLGEDSCMQGNLCVPNQILQGLPTPACSGSIPFLGSYTGVCLSDCLDFGAFGFALSRGNCAQDHTCAPCEDPLTGDPTGAPGCPM